MREELDILKIVANNPSISQRKIAENTGISLGQVNFLIKKCVKKGLIKIEGQTSKSIKYNLTPIGFSEKTKLTTQYIKISYEAVITLTNRIRSLALEYGGRDQKIYACGEDDELMAIVKLALNHVMPLVSPVENSVILYWDIELMNQKQAEFPADTNRWINILE